MIPQNENSKTSFPKIDLAETNQSGFLPRRSHFAKLLKTSYLVESDRSASNSPCCAKDKKLLKQSDVFRNLIDVAKEESTDDTGCKPDKSDTTFTKKTSSFAKPSKNIIPKETDQSENESQNESTNKGENNSDLSAKIFRQCSETKPNITDHNSEFTKRIIRDHRRVTTYQASAENLFKNQTDPLSLLFYSDSENNDGKDKEFSNESSFRHLIFSPNCTVSKKEMLRFLTRVKKGLSYSVASLKSPSISYISLKKSELLDFPKSLPGKKTLVLDLDETIIWAHCTKEDVNTKRIELTTDQGIVSKFYIKSRPFLQEFLRSINQFYEIIAFTAATLSYAKASINAIDPENKYFRYVLSRDNCFKTKNGFFIKDLRIIDRELKNIVIVDDLVQSFGFQIDNGIPILAFNGNSEDNELVHLAKYLKTLAAVDDIRIENRSYLRLRSLLETGAEGTQV